LPVSRSSTLCMPRDVYSSISLPQNPTNYFGFSYFCTNCTRRRHIAARRRVHIIILFYIIIIAVCTVYSLYIRPKGYSSHAHSRSTLPVTYVVFSAHDRKCCQNDYCKNMQKSVLSRINRLRPARRWRVLGTRRNTWTLFYNLTISLISFFFTQLCEFADRKLGLYRSRKLLCYINKGGNLANRNLGFDYYRNIH